MYVIGEHRGHETSSTIKTFIDNWYVTNLLNYKEYLSDFVVCSDRGFTSDDWVPIGLPNAEKYSDVYYRLRTTNKPQLICSAKEDAYTVSDTEVGNGELTYPIGLLTADEAHLVGGYNFGNDSYYLYTNQKYYLASPLYVNTLSTYVFAVNGLGRVESSNTTYLQDVRPVISLSPMVSVSGTGHWDDPYIVHTD